MPTPAQISYLAGLPPHPDQHRCGARSLHPVPGSISADHLPKLAALLANGVPDAPIDYMGLVGERYNQGSSPSCVAYSDAGMVSFDGAFASDHWDMFDAQKFYQECGGNGTAGIDSGLACQKLIDTGIGFRGNPNQRAKIGAYAFVPKQDGLFEQTVMAALVAKRVVTLAFLLPLQFGWDSSGGETQGYHQVVVCGQTGLGPADQFIILNSWGGTWANNGFGRVPIAYVKQNNFQAGYAYLITHDPSSFLTPPPPPPPPPNPGDLKRVFALVNQARSQASLPALFENSELDKAAGDYALKMGQTNHYDHTGLDGSTPLTRIQAAGGHAGAWGENIAAGTADPDTVMNLWLNSPGHKANILSPTFKAIGLGHGSVPNSQFTDYWVQDFSDWGGVTPPPPPPSKLVISGLGRVGPGNVLQEAQPFDVLGAGFGGAGILTVTIAGTACAVSSRSESLIVALAPSVPVAGPLHVQIEGAGVDGPVVTVQNMGPPPPPPPGDLKVDIKTMRFHNGLVYVWAYVKDSQGSSVPANCEGTAGGQALALKPTAAFGGCFWFVHVALGNASITVSATSLDGTRQGSQTVSVPGEGAQGHAGPAGP